MLVDESASATVKQLGDALSELEVNGHFFGSVHSPSSSTMKSRVRWAGDR
jgi:hypothetical protein